MQENRAWILNSSILLSEDCYIYSASSFCWKKKSKWYLPIWQTEVKESYLPRAGMINMNSKNRDLKRHS